VESTRPDRKWFVQGGNVDEQPRVELVEDVGVAVVGSDHVVQLNYFR